MHCPQYFIEPKLSKQISLLWINYKSPETSQQNPCFSPLRFAARCQTRICQYHLSCGRYHSCILTYVFREHFTALLSRSQFQGFSLCTRFETNPKIIHKIQTDTHLLDQIMGVPYQFSKGTPVRTFLHIDDCNYQPKTKMSSTTVHVT